MIAENFADVPSIESRRLKIIRHAGEYRRRVSDRLLIPKAEISHFAVKSTPAAMFERTLRRYVNIFGQKRTLLGKSKKLAQRIIKIEIKRRFIVSNFGIKQRVL